MQVSGCNSFSILEYGADHNRESRDRRAVRVLLQKRITKVAQQQGQGGIALCDLCRDTTAVPPYTRAHLKSRKEIVGGNCGAVLKTL